MFLSHLKRPQNKIEHQPHLWVDVVWDEGKNDVVYTKERYQQQSGFSQSPTQEAKRRNYEVRENAVTKGCSFQSVKLQHFSFLSFNNVNCYSVTF